MEANRRIAGLRPVQLQKVALRVAVGDQHHDLLARLGLRVYAAHDLVVEPRRKLALRRRRHQRVLALARPDAEGDRHDIGHLTVAQQIELVVRLKLVSQRRGRGASASHDEIPARDHAAALRRACRNLDTRLSTAKTSNRAMANRNSPAVTCRKLWATPSPRK